MASKMTRREARETVFSLLFESDFQGEDAPEEILSRARDDREFGEDEYVDRVYAGVMAERDALDALIGKYSNGWKTERISHVSRAVLRLATYEMLHCKEIPTSVSLNEAVELIKKYDDPKARAFANGVLNSIKNEIEGSIENAQDAKAEIPADGSENA